MMKMKKLLTALTLIIGLTLSVVLHELLHIILHWGNITAINFFPPNGNIVQVVANTPDGYNVMLEEIFAYAITAIAIIITVIIAHKNYYKN